MYMQTLNNRILKE